MKDPYGTILILIRDDPAVSAIVGNRVSAVAEEPPSVRLRAQPTSMFPFGPGSTRVGIQSFVAIAQCYGTVAEDGSPDPTGEIQARQLAGAVVDALHRKGAHHGATFIARMYTPEIGEILRDPDTDWPYHTVRIEAYAATQVVA